MTTRNYPMHQDQPLSQAYDELCNFVFSETWGYFAMIQPLIAC
jgi:hypothetical protein